MLNRQANILAGAVRWNGATQSFEGRNTLSSTNLLSVLVQQSLSNNVPFKRLVDSGSIPISLFTMALDTSGIDATPVLQSSSLTFTGTWSNPDKYHMCYKFHYEFKPTTRVRENDAIQMSLLSSWYAQDTIEVEKKEVAFSFPGVDRQVEVDSIMDVISNPNTSMTSSRVYGSLIVPYSVRPFVIVVDVMVYYKDHYNTWSANPWWLNFSGAYSISFATGLLMSRPVYKVFQGTNRFHEEEEDITWYREAFNWLYYVRDMSLEWEFV